MKKCILQSVPSAHSLSLPVEGKQRVQVPQESCETTKECDTKVSLGSDLILKTAVTYYVLRIKMVHPTCKT